MVSLNVVTSVEKINCEIKASLFYFIPQLDIFYSDHPPHPLCLQNLDLDLEDEPEKLSEQKQLILPGNPPLKRTDFIYSSKYDVVMITRRE